MKIKSVFLFSIFILFIQSFSFGQVSVYTKANEYFQNGQYYKAIDMLRDAYSKVTDNDLKNDITFQVAECYRLTDQPKKAEMWFKKSVQKKYHNPLVYLYYADALRMNGKFDDASENYKEYKKLVPDDPRGENGIKSCGFIKNVINAEQTGLYLMYLFNHL